MTLPRLPDSEEEKWQSPPLSLRTRLFSFLSLPYNSSKHLLFIPIICLLFTLLYIVTYVRGQPLPPSQPLSGDTLSLSPFPSDIDIRPVSQQSPLDSSSHPSILIFQHFAFHDDRVYKLQNESITQHERYARYWGYGYIRSFDSYVPMEDRTTRQKQMNKLYALLKVVLGEVALGDKGADWIMITDADTMIINPLVPIHSLLPPPDIHQDTPPLILGTEDWNGFNSGVMLLRCGLDLVAFISRALVISDNVTWDWDHPDSSFTQWEGELAGEEKESPPSDQRALCLVLQTTPVTARRYYPYPQEWFNSYDLPNADEIMILQKHFVSDEKYSEDLSQDLNAAREGWKGLSMKSPDEVQERIKEIESRARKHWETVELGAPKCTWI